MQKTQEPKNNRVVCGDANSWEGGYVNWRFYELNFEVKMKELTKSDLQGKQLTEKCVSLVINGSG